MKKLPEQLTGRSTAQSDTNTAQHLKQQWQQVYQAILNECTTKAQAPTVRCLDTASRIDELLVKLCASPSTDTPEVRALYAALHQYLAVVATELAQLHFTTATPALKNLQLQIPQHSQLTLFGRITQIFNQPAAPQFTNGPDIDSPPMFNLVMDVIIHGITPYLSRRDLQHWFWSCTFFRASGEMLHALKNKPIDPNPLAAGFWHTLMRTPQGELYSWGGDNWGQLGLGHEQDQNTPQLVTALAGKSIQSIACGNTHSLALCSDGSVYSWGQGRRGQLGLGHYDNSTTPQLVTVLVGKSIQSMACGDSHNLALCSDGSVYSWGGDDKGQLGLGLQQKGEIPQLITALAGKSIQSIACGHSHSLALCSDGSVYSWGDNKHGQLGLGHQQHQHTPQLVTALVGKSIQGIACGHSHNLALCSDGSVYSWGYNLCGQLGLSHKQNQNTPQLVTTLVGKSIQSIACGYSHSLALCSDGSVYSWGYNLCGQLGLGHKKDQNTPQLVTALADKAIESIVCGHYYCIAVGHDGSVYDWGDNSNGQLGLGHRQNQHTPQLLTIKQNSKHHDDNDHARSCTLM